MTRYLEHLTHEEMLRELGLICPEQRKTRRKNSVYKYLIERNTEEARLYLVVPSENTRGPGHKLNI